MFKEVLLITPKLSTKEMNDMERNLSRRFANVAKKFGKGMQSTLLGGGIAGAALSIVDKILNPLKEIQEAIDRTINKADDTATNAEQFDSTSGRLFRLQRIAQARGLDEGGLATLISKFQTAVAEAAADPKKDSSVRAYVGDTDTVASFFQFIQSLQRMPKGEQLLVQQDVFGEKQILKMAEFLRTDFPDMMKRLGGPTADQMTPKIDALGAKKDFQDLLSSQMETRDTMRKGGLITNSMIAQNAQREELAKQKENDGITRYNNLAALSIAADTIANGVQKGITELASLVVRVTNLSDNLKKLGDSPALKGIMRYMGGGK